MKYVVFEEPNGARFPVLFGDQVTHASVALEGAKPISAGEFMLKNNGQVETYGYSASTKLKPRRSDARMIGLTLLNANALLVAANFDFIERKRERLPCKRAEAPSK